MCLQLPWGVEKFEEKNKRSTNGIGGRSSRNMLAKVPPRLSQKTPRSFSVNPCIWCSLGLGEHIHAFFHSSPESAMSFAQPAFFSAPPRIQITAPHEPRPFPRSRLPVRMSSVVPGWWCPWCRWLQPPPFFVFTSVGSVTSFSCWQGPRKPRSQRTGRK